MKETICSALVAFIFLFLLVRQVQAQKLALPNRSYIYPDTFAVYVANDHFGQKNVQCPFNLQLTNLFDDELNRIETITDSIFHLPFQRVYDEARSIAVEIEYLCNTYPGHETRSIRIVPKVPKIEALLELTYSHPEINTLKMLGKAYEEQECYLNLYWVISKMVRLDAAAANLYFNEFCKRHKEIFLYGRVERDKK